MSEIVNRLLILVCCIPQLAARPIGMVHVAALLVAVTTCALNGYFTSPTFRRASIGLFLAASVVRPSFCLFLPVVYYDAFEGISAWSVLAAAGAVAASFTSLPVWQASTVTALVAISWALKFHADTAELKQAELRELRDSTQELTMQLTQKNKELLQKQDYEIRLATLNERARIAREIHDHVGHLLSRSILQVGALMVTQIDEGLRTSLSVIRDTLSQAMNSIRTSVHDLHDESFDLRTQVEELIRSFSFCEIRLNYKLESEPHKEIAYCFIAVIKEGLNNVMRHSDATLVNLSLHEHPALYQLVLQDNGSGLGSRAGGNAASGPDGGSRPGLVSGSVAGAGNGSGFGSGSGSGSSSTPGGANGTGSLPGASGSSGAWVAAAGDGLGLRNIGDRVAALGGQFLVEYRGGFRLFISVPKRKVNQ